MLQTSVRAPVSHAVAIADLRPTQMTLGMHEVTARSAKLKKLAKAQGDKFLKRHIIPVVRGPKDRYYVIDHHHLCRALLEAGLDDVSVTVVLDLQRLEKEALWVYLDNTGLLHPFDEQGKRRDYCDIPKSVKDMQDDPFRSLAGALRQAGGYAKDTTPFSEFLWADYLRRQMDRADVEKDFPSALTKAMKIAKNKDADFLPGWCGPTEDDR